MFDYVCIDFETANRSRNSACSLGLVAIKNSVIVNQEYFLINPADINFGFTNTRINNITYEMVMNEPYFDVIWDKVKEYFQDEIIVSHNNEFDIGVLNATMKYYNIQKPNFRCLDTLFIARNYITGLENNRLETVCKYLNFKFNHHNALEDARACKAIVDFALAKTGLDIESFMKNIDSLKEAGINSKSNGKIVLKKHEHIKISEITTQNTNFDTMHPFYKKNVVFTGELSIGRKVAMQKVRDVGGVIKSCVSPKTDYLIVGVYNQETISENKCSTKEAKADQYIANGIEIKKITESQFWKLLNNSSMIIGNEYTVFSSFEEKINFLKRYAVIPTDSTQIKPIYYSGSYTDTIEECDVVGYIDDMKESITFVIKIAKGLLPIHSSYLKEMQPTKKEEFRLLLENIFEDLKREYELQPNNIVLSDNVSLKGERKGTVISQSICIIEVAYPIGASSSTVSTSVLKIDYDTKVVLSIREKQYNSIPIPPDAEIKELNGVYSLTFSPNSVYLFDYIRENIRYCLDHYYSKSSFGCCSRFIQCSDAKKCVHENKLYAKGCIYRRSLDAGQIFYGKNKNI